MEVSKSIKINGLLLSITLAKLPDNLLYDDINSRESR